MKNLFKKAILFTIGITLLLIFQSCFEQQKSNQQSKILPKNIRIVSQYLIANNDNNYVLCSNKIRPFSKMHEYDCAFTLDNVTYSIRDKYTFDKTGNITDVQARAPHKRLQEEAIRVVKSLPKMIPGKQRGRAVGVKYSLPIAFKVE